MGIFSKLTKKKSTKKKKKGPTYLKLPKKPKMSASVTVKENYLKRVDEIQTENAKRKKDWEDKKKKNEKYTSIIRGIRASDRF